jgi:hypothetical protein
VAGRYRLLPGIVPGDDIEELDGLGFRHFIRTMETFNAIEDQGTLQAIFEGRVRLDVALGTLTPVAGARAAVRRCG